MEPRKFGTPLESDGKGQTSPPGPPQRKRRFQIIKLEERIAPGGGHGKGSNATCEQVFTCENCIC
jgi:hypothetical protein